jgi:twitching motility protein PilT
VITLEEPIEYFHRHKKSIVNQREIGTDCEDFASGLRAALRQDPDVILIGEMRDLETISTALTAAETGHLVFSTLHTTGAAKTIDRIIDVFPPHQQGQVRTQLSLILKGVISQQLLLTQDQMKRVAAIEVMTLTTAISNLIREGKTHQIQSNIQTGRTQGMISMDASLAEMYRKGIISRDSAITHAVDREYVSRILGS